MRVLRKESSVEPRSWSQTLIEILGKVVMDDTPGKLKYAAVWVLTMLATIVEYILIPIGGPAILVSPSVVFIFVLFVLDFILGLVKSNLNKDNPECSKCKKSCKGWSSNAAGKGALKGAVYVVIAYVGLGLAAIEAGLVLNLVTTLGGGLIILLLCITEILSILENLSCITLVNGVEIPILQKLLKYFHQKEDEILDNDDEDEDK
jgi:hypothetical protein